MLIVGIFPVCKCLLGSLLPVLYNNILFLTAKYTISFYVYFLSGPPGPDTIRMRIEQQCLQPNIH